MAQHDVQKLDSRATFPTLTFDLVGGGSLALPSGQWSVLLLYRGYW